MYVPTLRRTYVRGNADHASQVLVSSVTNNAREGFAVKRVSTVSNVCAFVSVLFFCLTFFLGGVGKQLAPGATGPQATSLKGDLLPLAPCPPNQRQAEKTKLTHTRTRVWASWLNSTCCRAWLHVWQTCNDAQFCKSVKLSQAQQQALLQQMQSLPVQPIKKCHLLTLKVNQTFANNFNVNNVFNVNIFFWRTKVFDVKSVVDVNKVFDVKQIADVKKLLTSKFCWRQKSNLRQKRF